MLNEELKATGGSLCKPSQKFNTTKPTRYIFLVFLPDQDMNSPTYMHFFP